MGYYYSGLGFSFEGEASIEFGADGWKSQGQTKTQIDEPVTQAPPPPPPPPKCMPGLILSPAGACECPAGLEYINGKCTPKCPATQIRNPDGSCRCPPNLQKSFVPGTPSFECLPFCPPTYVRDFKTKACRCPAGRVEKKSKGPIKITPRCECPPGTVETARPGPIKTTICVPKTDTKVDTSVFGKSTGIDRSIYVAPKKRSILDLIEGVPAKAKEDPPVETEAPPTIATTALPVGPPTTSSVWPYVGVGVGLMALAGVVYYATKD